MAVQLTAGLLGKVEGSVPGAAVFTALIGTIKVFKDSSVEDEWTKVYDALEQIVIEGNCKE